MGSILKTCPQCKRQYVPELTLNIKAMAEWANGKLIQDAFPNATSDQREQIQSGICSTRCWEAYLT